MSRRCNPELSYSDSDFERERTHQRIKKVNLPYFDYLFGFLKAGNTAVEKSFGRHVHWGFWQNPERAALTAADFADAAENLTHELCLAGRLRDGLDVLDAGCGFGGTVAHINEHFAGMDLVGINIDERQLQRACSLIRPLPRNRIAFVQGDACELPFPDCSFDVVLAVECIFHFPSRQRFFQEARRVLKPGGYLALSDFIPEPLIAPLVNNSLPERIGGGFYGRCNLQCTARDYRNLSELTQMEIRTERDITVQTLPTYHYLRRLVNSAPLSNLAAIIETAAIEVLSRLGLVKYVIYAFQKL